MELNTIESIAFIGLVVFMLLDLVGFNHYVKKVWRDNDIFR